MAPVILVMGVAGSGKSTLGRAVAEALALPYLEADDLHSPASVEKMRAGVPLTDEDRAPWLEAVGAWLAGRATSGKGGVTACSALKARYRAVLRAGAPDLRIVYLSAPREIVEVRMAARKNHYYPTSLIPSQYEALEPPGPEEKPIIVSVEMTTTEQVAVVKAAI